MRRRVLVACAVAACGTPAAAPAPSIPAAPPARPDPAPLTPIERPTALDDAVAPTAYRLELELDPARDQYRGRVAIDLALARPTRAIWLHAVDLVIEDAAAEQGGATWPAIELEAATGTELVGFDLGRTVPAGRLRLSIDFRGPLRTSNGLFAQERGGRRYLFSDFEPTDARRAFPCFDEPRFKVPWTVAMTVPIDLVAAGNMPVVATTDAGDGRVRVELAPTRPLPSYLIAVAVGPFDVIETRGAPVPVRLLVPRGRGGRPEPARALAPAAVAATAAFVGRPVPFPKLDFVAVPIFNGAMENPGLITVASDILLGAADEDGERFLAMVIAHEAAHLWFGDLATLTDWRDLWLHEGIATWIADEVLVTMRPSWRSRLVELDDRDEAIAEDEVAGVHAVRPAAISSPREMFDVIGYKKSAAVLHMIEGWLGPAAVRAALDRYLERHADGSVTTDDLIAALVEAAPEHGRDVERVLRSFLERPGVPRVDGAITCDAAGARVAVRPAQHVLAATGASAWAIPLCLRWHDGEAVRRQCQLVDAAADIPLGPRCPRWLTLNGDADGYYRWSLPPDDLARLATAREASVRERVDAVQQLEPALLSAVYTPADAAVVLRAALRRGAEPVALAALEPLRLLRDEVEAPVAAELAPVLAARARAVGTAPRKGESDDARALRPALLVAAGRAGDAQVIAWARRVALRALARRGATPIELVAAAFTVAAAERAIGRRLIAAVKRGALPPPALAAAVDALAGLPPDLAGAAVDAVVRQPRLQRAALTGLLARLATATPVVDAAQAEPALALVVADVGPCDTALADRLSSTARAKLQPLKLNFDLPRALRRATARAEACAALRRRGP